jgi:hypothetical protein
MLPWAASCWAARGRLSRGSARRIDRRAAVQLPVQRSAIIVPCHPRAASRHPGPIEERSGLLHLSAITADGGSPMSSKVRVVGEAGRGEALGIVGGVQMK